MQNNREFWNLPEIEQEQIGEHEIAIDNKHQDSREKIPWVKLIGGFLIPETVRAGRKIDNKNYKDVIISVKSVIPEFLYKIYDLNFKIRSNKLILKEDLEKSIDYIVNYQIIPFTRHELYDILKKINIKEWKANELEDVAKKVYNVLYDFYEKILIELLG